MSATELSQGRRSMWGAVAARACAHDDGAPMPSLVPRGALQRSARKCAKMTGKKLLEDLLGQDDGQGWRVCEVWVPGAYVALDLTSEACRCKGL